MKKADKNSKYFMKAECEKKEGIVFRLQVFHRTRKGRKGKKI